MCDPSGGRVKIVLFNFEYKIKLKLAGIAKNTRRSDKNGLSHLSVWGRACSGSRSVAIRLYIGFHQVIYMKNKPLLYGLFGFIIGSSLTLWLMLDGRATQSQVAERDTSVQPSAQPRSSAAYGALQSGGDRQH